MDPNSGLPKPKRSVFKITKVDRTVPNTKPSVEPPVEVLPVKKRRSPHKVLEKCEEHKEIFVIDKACKASFAHTELALIINHWLNKGQWKGIAQRMGEGSPEKIKAMFYQLIDTTAGILSAGNLETTYISPLLFMKILYACIIISDSLNHSDHFTASLLPSDSYILSVIKRSRLTVEKCEECLERVKLLFISIMWGYPILAGLNNFTGLAVFKKVYEHTAEAYNELSITTNVLPIDLFVVTLLEKAMKSIVTGPNADPPPDQPSGPLPIPAPVASKEPDHPNEEIKGDVAAAAGNEAPLLPPAQGAPTSAAQFSDRVVTETLSRPTRSNSVRRSQFSYFVPETTPPPAQQSARPTSAARNARSPPRVSDFTMVTTALKRLGQH